MVNSRKNYDVLIIGGGILGLSLANAFLKSKPNLKIAILEKEKKVALHASGRNSGVLHAGFYYTPDSLKAKFTKEGNRSHKEFCKQHGLSILECGKLVVAGTEKEEAELEILKSRADENEIDLKWVTKKEAEKIEPLVKTRNKALFSPSTACINPVEICKTLAKEISKKGVNIFTSTSFKRVVDNSVFTDKDRFDAKFIVNASGLYADKLAKQFGFSSNFTIIPFKGIYLKSKPKLNYIKTNIYPVPNLDNPFLGVHFTLTMDGAVKIGPTAIPAFWREHYKGLSNFNLNEFFQIISKESALFLKNTFNFRQLAIQELKKYNKKYLLKLANRLVMKLDPVDFKDWGPAGMRAQLLNIKTGELVQDFVVEGDKSSVHILNAVSPAFTCATPFAEWIVQKIHKKDYSFESGE